MNTTSEVDIEEELEKSNLYHVPDCIEKDEIENSTVEEW